MLAINIIGLSSNAGDKDYVLPPHSTKACSCALFLASAVRGLEASAALLPVKNRQYPLSRRSLGGLENRSGHFGEEKNFILLPRFEPRKRITSACM